MRRSVEVGIALGMSVLLAGCSGGSPAPRSQSTGRSSVATTAPGASTDATPSVAASSATEQPSAFDAIAKDAPPLPLPNGANQYAVALAQSSADYRTCLKTPAGKTTCKKPASLGSRDLKRNVNVEIVLDASGSMKDAVGGRSKIDIARDSIATFVSELPKSARVSVRTFGNGADEPKNVSCASSRLVLPFQAPDAARVQATLSRTVVRGYTPLAGALVKAKTDFGSLPAADNSNFVYVVSDGEETCDGDPVQAAKALTSADVGVQVNVIGFSVNSTAAAQLRAAASAGGGVYADATDDKALDKAFTQAGDWRAWTAYYNCRYGEVEHALGRAEWASVAEEQCVVDLASREQGQTDEAGRQLRDELQAQLDARKAYIGRKAEELPLDARVDVDNVLNREVVEADNLITQANTEVGRLSRERFVLLTTAAKAHRAGKIAAAQAEHDKAVAELQQTRDALGISPGG